MWRSRQKRMRIGPLYHPNPSQRQLSAYTDVDPAVNRLRDTPGSTDVGRCDSPAERWNSPGFLPSTSVVGSLPFEVRPPKQRVDRIYIWLERVGFDSKRRNETCEANTRHGNKEYGESYPADVLLASGAGEQAGKPN
jgi:hypothetical protein